jgi:dTDP-D-glucose 4,6-dehydratase
MTESLNKLKKKNILVTGGLGFIGRNLIEELTSTYECNVIILDDETNASGYGFQMFSRKDQLTFRKVSVLEYEKVFSYLEKVH